MQTVEEFKNEEVLNKKIRQKRRIRGVLIIVNALLIAYASYLSVVSIVDAVKHNKDKEQGDIITLLDKNPTKSLELYNEYITSKEDVIDVAIYGNYLLTSSSRVTHNSFKKEGSVTLFIVVDDNPSFNEPNLVYLLNENINSQIDLFSLEQGDYLIYSNFDVTTPNLRTAIHYTGTTLYEETIYSLPLEDGSRRKISVKGKESSPALVISVTNVSACPEEYYDFVVLDESTSNTKNTKWVDTLSKKYKIKEVSTLVDAYKVNASFAININELDKVYTTSYLGTEDLEGALITRGPLSGLDKNNAIRELGGYLFNAGYGVSVEDSDQSISDASIAIKNNLVDTTKGKLTLVVGSQIEEEIVLEQINNIFKA